jgi:DNA-binding SARP family transcriptional activator
MQALTRQTWRSRPGHLIGWRDPEGAAHQLDLDAGPAQVSIGRHAGNDVALPWDHEVSRVHARLERMGADWTLRDDGLSHNGTWVNGERLTGIRRLLDGDVVRVGRTTLTVRASARAESPSPRGASGGIAAADARVVVRLCGPLLLRIDGRRLEGQLSGRMGRRLFAYLVCKRGQPVRRDELTGVLWPRALPASPQACLSVHVARLRRVLGEHALVGRGDVTLDFADDAFVDVEAAVGLARVARAQLAGAGCTDALGSARAARGILEAELLPEFAEDDWVAELRLELDSLVPELLEIEAEAALTVGGGELVAAEAAARALLRRRPYRESDCRLLMRAHAARGNLAEALLVYEELRHRLMDDLGIPPPTETRALYERLLADETSPSPRTATSRQEH